MTEDPITEDYLFTLAAVRARNSGPYAYETCKYCAPHAWHGQPCQPHGLTCDCPTSRAGAA